MAFECSKDSWVIFLEIIIKKKKIKSMISFIGGLSKKNPLSILLIFQPKEFSSPGFLGLVVATGKLLAACWFVDLCF